MCRWTIGTLAVTVVALAVSGCGGTSKGATTPRPPAPVNLTVYIDDSRVSVAPTTVGAGPVAFIVTNQASQAESLALLRRGGAAGQPLANTGPINPQATAQFTVNFTSPGTYSLGAAGGGSIKAASIHIGRRRASSDNQVLQP
jgi:hypothetical protein